jgi:hypothetical protein
LTGAVSGGTSKYCTSCYTGVYPVAFPRDEAAYLQLALKLNPEPAPSSPQPVTTAGFDGDDLSGGAAESFAAVGSSRSGRRQD